MTLFDTPTSETPSTPTPSKRRLPPLEQRISEALADESADRDALMAVWRDAWDRTKAAEETIKTETARALDIENEDPDASDEAATKARLTIERLTIAMRRLKERVAEIDSRDYAVAWLSAADQLEIERDKLADELRETYAPFVASITALYAKIDQNTRALDDLARQAPANVDRRFLCAERKARGLSSYSASQPPLRDHMKLPDWEHPRDIAFPVDELAQIQRAASHMTVNAIHAMEARSALLYGPDWAEAQKLANEQRREESEQRDAKLAAQQAEKKREFEQSVLAADRYLREIRYMPNGHQKGE